MVDEYDMEASMEVAEQLRSNQPGRINTPERKEARVRARAAAEKAAAEVRKNGHTIIDNTVYRADEIGFPLADKPAIARAAGLAVPRWWVRLWRWLRGR